MTALLLALAIFLACAVVGVALLALVRADTRSLHVALTAPALGSCVFVIPAFLLSYAGLAIDSVAVPLVAVLLVASIVVLVVRRPRLAAGVTPSFGLCLVGLVLAGWPTFTLGFHWLANANSDMSSYVLGAVQLMHHGLLAPLDASGLNRGTDYATTTVGVNLWGQRPGSDLILALTAHLTGRIPYEIYMPLSLAMSLTAGCGVGAFAFTVSRRRWIAVTAVAVALVSPLFTYGVVQQLLPQVWGVAILIALLAWLMRVELHKRSGTGIKLAEVIPIGLMLTGIVLVYVEILPELIAAYGLYVLLIALRREVRWRTAVLLWAAVVVIALVLLNAYALREAGYLMFQVGHGTSEKHPPLFGFITVPSALPGVLGLQTLPAVTGAPLTEVSIGAALALLVLMLIRAVAGLRSASPIATGLIVYAALAGLLVVSGADFGLFKLAMYLQPLLATAFAVWCLSPKKRSTRALGAAALVAIVAFQLSTQHAYVQQSLKAIDVPDASSDQLMPAFSHMVASNRGPTVSATENPFVIELEASRALGKPLYFFGRDLFGFALDAYAAHSSGARRTEVERERGRYPWHERYFDLHDGGATDEFKENVAATEALTNRSCRLVMSSGQTLTLNRLSLPATMPALVNLPCKTSDDLLVFTQSRLGESFYVPAHAQNVSFWQLQEDPYFHGSTMAGFGRYALFRIIGPPNSVRLEVSLSTTLLGYGSRRLPPATVVGAKRRRLPLVGNGSARVFSPVLTPQFIDGQPYLLLDMGIPGREPPTPRSGLQALYGKSVPLDTRFLTSYVRDVSLVSAKQYAQLRPPSSLSEFPVALENTNLQYSGIYEDGWMGADAYAVLAGGRATNLVVRGEVPSGAGKHVELLVNGHVVLSKAIAPGPLSLRAPVAASSHSRRVELRFAATIRLKPPDNRPAAAHLSFLGFEPR